MSDTITIEFIAKDLYQPRKDYKKDTWFALSNTIMENPDYNELTVYQFKALIYLYCEASKNRWKPTTIHFRYAKKFHDIEPHTLFEVINLLEENQKLITICTDSVRNLYAKERKKDIKERNNQPEKNALSAVDDADQNAPVQKSNTVVEMSIRKPSPPPIPIMNDVMRFENRARFDFAALVNTWPKQLNKTKALRKLERDIGTPEQYAKLKVAVDNAIDFYRHKEYDFIPSFVSFLDGWEDFLIKRTSKPAIEINSRGRPELRGHTPKPVSEVFKESESYAQKLEAESFAPSDADIKRGAELLKRLGAKVPPKFEGEK